MDEINLRKNKNMKWFHFLALITSNVLVVCSFYLASKFWAIYLRLDRLEDQFKEINNDIRKLDKEIMARNFKN